MSLYEVIVKPNKQVFLDLSVPSSLKVGSGEKSTPACSSDNWIPPTYNSSISYYESITYNDKCKQGRNFVQKFLYTNSSNTSI